MKLYKYKSDARWAVNTCNKTVASRVVNFYYTSPTTLNNHYKAPVQVDRSRAQCGIKTATCEICMIAIAYLAPMNNIHYIKFEFFNDEP
jgi:hypothetical protein